MDPLMISAASGLKARMESLDLLANNLANAGTAGYKSDAESYSVYVAQEALEPALDGWSPMPSTLPVVEGHWTDLAQGTLTPTGNPLDMALSTKGFFVVSGPGGPLYTRNGNFRLSTDGTLTTADGYAVLGGDGQPIRANGTGAINVSVDGTASQDGAAVGQLAVVNFDSPAGLDKCGKSYFRAADPATVPAPASEVEVHQGQLEASNVATPHTAVRLVSLMRQFEMLQKAISLGGEMSQKAVEEVAKVNS